MKNYCILKTPANSDSKPTLHIMVNQQLQVIIGCDRILTFVPQMDYEDEEIEYFLKISSMFYSFYNNIK